MQLSGNTVLITGGASGIGLSLAERFLQAGSEVIICGRNESKLEGAKQQYPQLHTRKADVGQEADRLALVQWVTQEFPRLNVLINNAGIQRRVNFVEEQEEWSQIQQEIAINLEAPIHLSSLFIPHLKHQETAAIINITSGLAFTPGTFAPVYSATKAAMHSFSMSLRHLLSKTSVQVIEIVPPAVQTDLGGVGIHTMGAPLDLFTNSVLKRVEEGELEIGYGTSETRRKASREELDEFFLQMNS